MEIISKVSKGSKMDQIYISKNRVGLNIGEYVVITPLSKEIKKQEKPYFYGIKKIEPLKLEIIGKIFKIIERVNPDNIIITGSFLNKGFRFNDIDILIISEEEYNLKEEIENRTGIKMHILFIDGKSLIQGLKKDPLYQMMLSKCVSKKRFLYKFKSEPDYKILDLHLLESKTLIDNYGFLNGDEKYYLIRNLISILLFIKNQKMNNERVDKEIKSIFGVKIEDIQENKLNKTFIKKYKEVYNKILNLILTSIQKESKNEQKQAN
jgi:predicted nucleotidyltransferase